jgi:hypothetical protein
MMGASDRWQAFLSQIEGRHRGVRDEAWSSAQAMIGGITDGDAAALSRAWSAAESRLQELEKMIIDTWHAKVDAAFAEENVDQQTRMDAYGRGDALKFTVENEREKLQQRIYAELARQLFARALADRRDKFCSACGAALALPVCFRAVEVRCSCGQTAMFEPGGVMRAVEAVGTHALSQNEAWAEWLAMREADRRARQVRPPVPLQLLKAYERAQIAYWRRYFAARALMEPEVARDPASFVRSRMDPWYRYSAQHEEEWKRAGDPREKIV